MKKTYYYEVIVKIKESQRVLVESETPVSEDEMLRILQENEYQDITDTETLEYNELESMQLLDQDDLEEEFDEDYE